MGTCDVSIIVVSWNARSYLMACLESITDTACGLTYEVIVVDNASSDGSPEAVRQAALPSVRLVETGRNLGFAKANNVAMRESCGRYYCLINSDVIVKPDCLQRLWSFMESHPEVGLAGPRLLNGDGTFQPSCRREPSLRAHFARAIFINTSVADPAYRGDATKEVAVLAGSFWIARREAVEAVGLLDESFFFYGEDHDWCRRFWNGGWKICFHPDAAAVHYGGASAEVDPSHFSIELQKAILRLREKYHGRMNSLAYLLIGMLYHGLRLSIRTLRLLWPRGERRSVIAKRKQHWGALRWQARAFGSRLIPSRLPGGGVPEDIRPSRR